MKSTRETYDFGFVVQTFFVLDFTGKFNRAFVGFGASIAKIHGCKRIFRPTYWPTRFEGRCNTSYWCGLAPLRQLEWHVTSARRYSQCLAQRRTRDPQQLRQVALRGQTRADLGNPLNNVFTQAIVRFSGRACALKEQRRRPSRQSPRNDGKGYHSPAKNHLPDLPAALLLILPLRAMGVFEVRER